MTDVNEIWQEFLTRLYKSDKKKVPPIVFYKEIELRGFLIITPASNKSRDELVISFLSRLLKSRKSREDVVYLILRENKKGYDIQYTPPIIDIDKITTYQGFIAEVIKSMQAGEPSEHFVARIEKIGYTLSFCPPSTERDFFVQVITAVNEICGTEFRYKFPSPNSRLILALRSQGFSIEDLISVVRFKAKEWKGTEYEIYLRPSTLFNEKKFENYIGQKKLNVSKAAKQSTGNFKDFAGAVVTAKETVKRYISRSDEAGE